MSEFDHMNEHNRFQMHGAESCALLQVHGIPDLLSNKLTPARVLAELLIRNGVAEWDEEDYFIFNEGVEPFWIITQALPHRSNGWVDKFAKWLEDEGLGKIVKTSAKANTSSYNFVKVYVYAPNVRALRAWARRNTKGMSR